MGDGSYARTLNLSECVAVMLTSKPSYLAALLLLGVTDRTWAQYEPGAFLKQFCVQCHGEKKPKADLSLRNLTDVPVKKSEIDTWKAVLDQLEGGDMPPKEAKQPSAEQRQQMLVSIKGMLRKAGVSLDESRWL